MCHGEKSESFIQCFNGLEKACCNFKYVEQIIHLLQLLETKKAQSFLLKGLLCSKDSELLSYFCNIVKYMYLSKAFVTVKETEIIHTLLNL